MANLTGKQAAFIDYYLGEANFNATEAARRAGYSGDDNTLSVIGFENLRKPNIDEAIQKRLQARCMGSDEVLVRLANMARGDIGEFASIENGAQLANHPLSTIVKKFKKTIFYDKDGDSHEKIELEMYDAHAALVNIGRHHKLFTDVTDHQGLDVVKDWLTELRGKADGE